MQPANIAETAADVLLVTVTKVESLAVLEAFKTHTGQAARLESRGGKAYHDLGLVNGGRVWLVLSEMGAGGLGGALQTVTKAIESLRPAAVIMAGIAFGVDEQNQAIGDILVSEDLRLYEPQLVGAGANIPRGHRPHASTWLLDACRNADLHWPGATVRFGCVLTGEKLVDNLGFREQLRRFEPEAIGGEMEGAGLYAACQDAKLGWILVKGICDWADGKKEQDRRPRQQLAARNAAEFVLHTLKTVPLNCERERGQGGGSEKPAINQTGGGAIALGDRNVVAGQGGIAIGGDLYGRTNS
jgi:nucleoside phosphorylase